VQAVKYLNTNAGNISTTLRSLSNTSLTSKQAQAVSCGEVDLWGCIPLTKE